MQTHMDALRRLTADLQGPRQIEALAEMDLELGNIQAAWSRAVASGQVRFLAQGMQGLGWFYARRIRFPDGAAVFQQSVDGLAPGAGPLEPETEFVRAFLQAWQGYFICPLGQSEAGLKLMFGSRELLRKAAAAGQDVRQYQAHSQLLIDLTQNILFRESDPADSSLALYQALNDSMEWPMRYTRWAFTPRSRAISRRQRAIFEKAW